MAETKRDNTPAKRIEFNGCEYKLIQRYKHNLCLYASESTFIVVNFKSEEGPGHQYFIEGMTFINGSHCGYDGDEYDLSPSTFGNSTGYANSVIRE